MTCIRRSRSDVRMTLMLDVTRLVNCGTPLLKMSRFRIGLLSLGSSGTIEMLTVRNFAVSNSRGGPVNSAHPIFSEGGLRHPRKLIAVPEPQSAKTLKWEATERHCFRISSE